MFTSVVFTSKSAFTKATTANNVVAVHEPFLMIIYQNLVQSKLDMRYVRYIKNVDNQYIGRTGLVIAKTFSDKFYDAADYLTKNKIVITDSFEGSQMFIIEIPKMGDFTKFYNQLLATGFFYDIEEDLTGKARLSDVALGTDTELPYPYFTYFQQGWLAPINAAEALATFNTIDANNYVAILDTRVDVNHVDLVGRTGYNFDCVTNTAGATYIADNIYYYELGAQPVPIWAKHGTAVAGIVAANSTNGVLVQSHTRNKVRAQVLRVLYPVWEPGGAIPYYWDAEDGTIYYETSITILVRALNKAWQNPKCAAISISWAEDAVTGVFGSSTIQSLMEGVRTVARNCKGIPIFAAAGNLNTEVDTYPALLESVITIGGTEGTTSGTSLKADFANYGNALWVSAPAVNVYTTDASGTNGYVTNLPNPLGTTEVVRFNGTSASAPIVAGVAAVMILVNPSLTEDQVRRILKDTAQQVGGYTYPDDFSQELGYGLVDMQAAVELADGYVDDVATDYTISITVPGTAQAGANVAIAWTVDIDPGYSNPTWTNCPSSTYLPKVTFYRSTSSEFVTSAAVPIGFITLDLEPGDTVQSGTFNYIIPCNTTGNMYIYAVVDSTDIIAETDENNNMDSGVITVSGLVPGCSTTDLAVTVVSTQIAANGQRRVTLTFTNTGLTNITTWNFTHGWLSNTGAPATVTFSYPSGSFLAPGASRSISLFAIQSPQGLPNTFFAQINTVNGAVDGNASNNYSSLIVNA